MWVYVGVRVCDMRIASHEVMRVATDSACNLACVFDERYGRVDGVVGRRAEPALSDSNKQKNKDKHIRDCIATERSQTSWDLGGRLLALRNENI